MDGNVVGTQVALAAAFVWIVQRLKSASWFPLIQAGQAKVTRIVSVAFAFLAHGGVSYVWNPALDINGNRHLDLAIPTLWGMALLFWHWFVQFSYQELIYQGTSNKLGVTTDATGSIPAKVSPTGAVVVPPPVEPAK